MSLAQDLRHAYEGHDRTELERLLLRVDALERASKASAKPTELVCSKCATNRLESPCPLSVPECPVRGTTL